MTLTIVPARLGHAVVLAVELRPEAVAHHADTKTTARVLAGMLRSSRISWAVLAGRHCIAVGGEIGAVLGPVGQVWGAVGRNAIDHRVALFRLVRAQLHELLGARDALQCYLLPGDAMALRFAEAFGFVVRSDLREIDGVLMREGWLRDPRNPLVWGEEAA